MQAVRFDGYGDLDVLEVREVEDPAAEPGRAVVRVKATAVNPGEMWIRQGALHDRFPARFPSGEGSDLAGVVEVAGGPFAAGDEVVGWSDERAAHAELVSVPVEQLVRKPAEVSWEIAGSLYVAGATAWAAVDVLALSGDDTVVVSAAAGGVGTLAVQLAVATGARVIALASEDNHEWLRAKGAEPMAYSDDGPSERRRAMGAEPAAYGDDGLLERLRAFAPTAFLDLFGGGYVELALALGVPAARINTIADFDAVATHGVQSAGNYEGARASVIEALAGMVARSELEVPIAATYPLADVRRAYADLAERHTRGKRVLIP